MILSLITQMVKIQLLTDQSTGCRSVHIVLKFKSQPFHYSNITIISHCLGLGQETMVCGICLSMVLHMVNKQMYVYVLWSFLYYIDETGRNLSTYKVSFLIT